MLRCKTVLRGQGVFRGGSTCLTGKRQASLQCKFKKKKETLGVTMSRAARRGEARLALLGSFVSGSVSMAKRE